MDNMHNKILGILLAGVLCWVQPALGEESYNIKEMTPQVVTALEGRRSRYDQLIELKAKGTLGENNKGYIAVLKNEGNAEAVAEGENSDRKIIYQTIADQNNLRDALSTIEKVFASVQRNKAAPGEMIQTEDGQWVKKK